MADTTLTIIQSAPEASVEVTVQPADQLNVTIEQGARGDRGLGESLPISSDDVDVPGQGTATEVLTALGAYAGSIDGRVIALEAAPKAATDLWYATAADNPGPVIYDHGDRRAHATFTPGVDGNASATGVIPLTEGTWSVHPTHDLIDKDRPRIPDRAGLAFADGVRMMWRGKLGVLEGWHPHNGIGFMDVLCNQSIGSDGVLDSLEPGLRLELDPPRIRGFMDSTPAGSVDLPGDEHQDYSDPLTLDQARNDTHLFDYRFDGGDRILDWYVPTAAGDTPDLSLPGEYVEDWTLHSTTTRTAPPGFYRSGLEWRLGDEPNALAFLKAWDLDTGDLEIDFDAADVTTAGWTDSAGNDWDTIVARVVEGPCIYVGQGTAYVAPVAANPGEGDWTLAWWAHHTDEIGTDEGEGGWTLTPDPGGAVLTLNDGTTSVDVPLGITDDDLHFVIVSLDRTAGIATATVDGLLVATEDISGLGNITGAAGIILPDGHTLRYLSFQADALSVPELDDLYSDVLASFAPLSTGLELGETSTTAYRGDRGKTAFDHSQLTTGNPHSVTASDVGAPPTSRAITAGTGLTGGGDLSTDRTLTVSYGLTASTAAEGIAVVHTPWRSGSYYGPTVPRVANAGQTLASGEARAMPFYNPVAGHTIDQLAVDVQSGSAGTGTLYVCTDDGTGYPGTVVASGTFTTPVSSTRMTTSVSYTLPRGLLWLVAHGTGTTWSGLTLDGQSLLMPVPGSYSTGGISCWRVTGAGTSTFTSFPSGGSLSTGVLVVMRAA